MNITVFLWENNYHIWHDQMISKGKISGLEVDIYSLFSEFLRDEGRWAIAPVTVVNRLQSEQKVFVSEIGNKIKPPERVTYILRHKDMSEAKINTLNIFEQRIHQYFEDSGLGRYMDRYTADTM